MLRLFWSLLLFAVLWVPPARAQAEFLPPDQAFQLSVVGLGDGQVKLSWDIRDGYYLYRRHIKIEGLPEGSVPAMPARKTISDEFFGESEVYLKHLELQVQAGEAQQLRISWQGCAEAGLCYPPQTRTVSLQSIADLSPSAAAANSGQQAAAPGQAEDQALSAKLALAGILWG